MFNLTSIFQKIIQQTCFTKLLFFNLQFLLFFFLFYDSIYTIYNLQLTTPLAYIGTAAAPCKQSTMDFFASIGIELCEIYGMSESTGATTISTPSAHMWGSVGWAVSGAEVKILNAYRNAEGELVKNNDECTKWGGKGSSDATDFDDMNTEEKKGKSPKDYHQGEICYRGRHIMMVSV